MVWSALLKIKNTITGAFSKTQEWFFYVRNCLITFGSEK